MRKAIVSSPAICRPSFAICSRPGQTVQVSFESPTPEGYHYLGRNNRFVEQLCQLVMANTLARVDKRAAGQR